MTKPKLSPINALASEAENQYLSPQLTLAMTYFVLYLWFLCRRLGRITGSRPLILTLMVSRRITVTSHVTAS